MVGVSIGRGPAVPYLGTFLETNVRLYSVTRPVAVAWSSSASTPTALLVVPAIRTSTGAPYRGHGCGCGATETVVTYDARLRRLGDRPRSHVVVRVGAPREATPLDDFLTAAGARTSARRRGSDVRARTRTSRGTLRDAEVLELDDELVAAVGLPGLTDRVRRTTWRSATACTPSSARTTLRGGGAHCASA